MLLPIVEDKKLPPLLCIFYSHEDQDLVLDNATAVVTSIHIRSRVLGSLLECMFASHLSGKGDF